MMCEVFPPFLLDIVVCDAQKHKYCIYKVKVKVTRIRPQSSSSTVGLLKKKTVKM